MRHLHAHDAAVEHLRDVLGAARRGARDCGHAARFGCHRQQIDALRRERAVLAVEQHPVEAERTEHLDELRRGDHHRDAERRLACAQLALHRIVLHPRLLVPPPR
ncbi:MAG: hypothetical protein M0015_10525 [Betaproteobacteria bacterium]|nr:hypothetical protein [Betaproteobacteria bacterium]